MVISSATADHHADSAAAALEPAIQVVTIRECSASCHIGRPPALADNGPREGRATEGAGVGDVDVLVIAALLEEYEAARSAAGAVGTIQWQPRGVDGPTPYLMGEYETPASERIRVALARPTSMGGRRTSPISTTLTDLLRPTCLAMCGVCAGNPDDTAPGDVIVASPAYEYDEGKLAGATFHGDHQQYPLNDRWLRAVQDFDPSGLPSYGAATEQEAMVWFLERLHRRQDAKGHPARGRYFPRGTWSARLRRLESEGVIASTDGTWMLTAVGTARIERILADDVDGPERLPFAVVPGPMASGSAVIQHQDIWARLKETGARKILGLEMEAATIATVAHEREVPHWLVVKGVMDNANLEKDDRFKEFAARASAEVLYALLGRLLPVQARVRNQQPHPARSTPAIPAKIKRDILQRLHFDWQDLADVLGVPPFERARFSRADEAGALWQWLDMHDRFAELPAALDEIGLGDLGDRLRPYVSS